MSRKGSCPKATEPKFWFGSQETLSFIYPVELQWRVGGRPMPLASMSRRARPRCP